MHPGEVCVYRPADRRPLHPQIISMDNVKQLSLHNVPRELMQSADVLLVLDVGAAILCHSLILSLHSAVLRTMFADLPARQGNERVKVPLL